MRPPDPQTRGILTPGVGMQRFTLERRPPCAKLRAFVERYWLIRWDLRGRPAHAQETLPYPCVNFVLGTHRPGLWGVQTRRFCAQLEGLGWVLGVKFRAGAFRPWLGRDLCTLTDRAVPVAVAFTGEGAELERRVAASDEPDARLAEVEAFLLDRAPEPSADGERAAAAVATIEADPSLLRVADLAARHDVHPRTLERLFRAHVGVSPKWVIRRSRVQEAAERVRSGSPPDWSRFAVELGYFDQSHFIRDFTSQVGATPTDYAAQQARAARVPSDDGAARA